MRSDGVMNAPVAAEFLSFMEKLIKPILTIPLLKINV